MLFRSMKEVEGFSVEELAARTGMNENTIKVKLFRARHVVARSHRAPHGRSSAISACASRVDLTAPET